MTWAYMDETINATSNAMIFGGCFGQQDQWDEFSVEWRSALADEKVSEFHASRFYSFTKPFDWADSTGAVDIKRHEAFRDRLGLLICQFADSAFCFSVAVDRTKSKAENTAYRLVVDDMFRDTSKWFWSLSEQPRYFVLARRSGTEAMSVLKRFEQIKGCEQLAGCGVFPPSVMPQLQAADYLLSAVNRKELGQETASFELLRREFRNQGKPFLTKLGPSSSASAKWDG